MLSNEIISISLPPFPDFIEGNSRTFLKGQLHPDRENIGYFDLLFIKKGQLFLSEDGVKHTISEKEMFILLPNKHHFSWKKCEEDTEFYWLHFYTTSKWKQSRIPSRFISELPIPDLHYHQHSYTLHLKKHISIKDPTLMFELIEEILSSTENENIDSIWRTEELFLRFLKYVESQDNYQDRLTSIAASAQLYLENNFTKKISNQDLSNHFHLHSNYISRAVKKVFEKTPLEVLEEIRFEHAKQYLLRTSMSINEISELVGFSSEVYFSNRFKKVEGISPQNYRKQYQDE